MKVAIDADHRGIANVSAIISCLDKKYDITFINYGVDKPYPRIAWNMAGLISEKIYDRGILICGTGIGMDVVANKVPGIYASRCESVLIARKFRENNNGNILCLGAEITSLSDMILICNTFLETASLTKSRDRCACINELWEGKYGDCC